MEADIASIVELLKRFGYIIVFLAALGEALPLVGLLIPGQAIVILAGALSATGHLSIYLVILAAFPAGILGDAVGYYVGRRYGRDLIARYGHKLQIGEAHLARSDELFRKYGPLALVIGRFSFLTRGIVPLLAGVSGIRQRVFWPVNVLGALAWAVAYGVLGYFFGAAWLQLEGLLGRILALTAIAVGALYMLYRVLRRYAEQFTRDDFYVALLGILGGTAFGILADRIQKVGHANVIDQTQPILVAILAPVAPALVWLEWLANYAVVGVITLALMGWLASKRRTWEATLAGMGVGGIILLVEILRPVFTIAFEPQIVGGAFPSAPAAIAVVFSGVATYMLAYHSVRAWPAWTALAVGCAFALVAGIAPVARGAHQPTDFLAGLALGIAWLSVSILMVEFGLKRTPRSAE